jgi:DNA-binding Lrp family transcriptional regulator
MNLHLELVKVNLIPYSVMSANHKNVNIISSDASILWTERLDIYCGIMIFRKVTSVFFLINIEFSAGDEIITKLRNMPEVVDVYRVQGMYDIIAKVGPDSEEDPKELVSERIRKIEGITGTVTIMIAQGWI